MRRQHQQDDEREHDINQRHFPRTQLSLGDATAAALGRGIIDITGGERRDPHRGHGSHDQHHGNHISHRIGDADRGDAQIGLRREHVLDVQQQRRGEIVEYLDEHKRRARDVTRQRERKHDAPKQPESMRPQILRSLLHRAVDIAQRRRQVDENEWKIMD